MKRTTIWITVTVVLVLTAFIIVRANACGWRGWCSSGWHRPGPGRYLAHELKLSDDQRAQIRNLWQTERPTISTEVHELLAENREMNALAGQDNPDQAKAQEIAARQATTIAALLLEKEKLQSKIYGTVLNPDQRAKFSELEDKLDRRLDHAADHLETQPNAK